MERAKVHFFLRVKNKLDPWGMVIIFFLSWVVFSCSIQGPNLRDDILKLREPDQRAKAERDLRAHGYDGMKELLHMGYASGHDSMISMALNHVKCPMAFDIHVPFSMAENMPLSFLATDFVMKWLHDDPKMFHRFLYSKDPLERTLAYVSMSANPDEFLANLNLMKKESDRSVVEWGIALGSVCSLLRAKTAKKRVELQKAIKDLAKPLLERFAAPDPKKDNSQVTQVDCRAPDFDSIELLVSQAKMSKLEPGGESWYNGALDLSFSGDGIKGSLDQICAMHLYKRAAKFGKYLPWLLMPMVGRMGFTPHSTRLEAAQLLIRDLEKFPEKKQNKILALAILAGAKAKRLVKFKGLEFMPDYDLLAAAAMQADPKAMDSLTHHFFCREAQSSFFSIQLLGFSNSPKAADHAYALAKNCKGRATTGAFSVLVRLHDPRAEELLDEIIKSGYKYVDFETMKTMAEMPNPAIMSRLEKAAEAGDQKAKTLLENIAKITLALGQARGEAQ